MGGLRGVEQDGVKFVSAVFFVVVLIVFAQNSGGFNQILKTLFGGLNNTVGQLLTASYNGRDTARSG